MRRTVVWIMLSGLIAAALPLLTGAREAMLRTPAQSLPPAEVGPNCTALVLDRVSGLTVAASCGASSTMRLEASVRDGPRVRT